MGALDFAGGTVVHINAGIAGFVGALLLGRRIGYGKEPMPPHSLTLTMVGASLLWVGWFGFNAGSNLEANAAAVLAMANTFIATGGGWCVLAARRMAVQGQAEPAGSRFRRGRRSRRRHPGFRLCRPHGRAHPRPDCRRGRASSSHRGEELPSAMTTRSTCSACMPSAACSAPSAPASSPTPLTAALASSTTPSARSWTASGHRRLPPRRLRHGRHR